MTLYNLGVPIGKKQNRKKQNKTKTNKKTLESGIHSPLKRNPEPLLEICNSQRRIQNPSDYNYKYVLRIFCSELSMSQGL